MLRVVIGLSILSCVLCSGQFCCADQTRPNIVYIMADELGYFEPSYMGNANIQTPNIDRLAMGGLRFSQALAGSSVCAPTRCCLMTGKHSGHTSVRSNGGGTPLREGEITIATLLKQGGYATGGFGKWGCGGRGSTGVPEIHGFDVFFGYYDQVHAHTYYPPYLIRNSQEVSYPGNKGLSSGDTYSHYEIFEAGKAFIRQHAKEPFFCYLPITPPHGIFDIPDDDPAWAIYEGRTWPEQAKRYAAMVSMVDRHVGEVVELLTSLGVSENTLIFFSGDNGGADYFASPEFPRGFHSANKHPKTGVEFRGKKGNLYEGGLRVPMIAYWPGKIQPGRESDLLCYFPDILPTVAELAGATAPKDIDGISLVPELLGTEAAGRAQIEHEYLYWEISGQTAIRKGDWKAVQPKANANWELYDLRSDISETQDLALKHPSELNQLKALAAQAHTPAEEGTFFNREIHERDRRAKFGRQDESPSAASEPKSLSNPNEMNSNAVPLNQAKVVKFSSENRGNRKLARHVIDGDPASIWHTQFTPTVEKHPHELILDLGVERELCGFRYLARQDPGWNGAFGKVQICISNSADKFAPDPWSQHEFTKSKAVQEVLFEKCRGRYVRLTILSEVNGGPWASAAEIGFIESR
ncbi:MAG: sulfatase-like hydrolase/transferase [Planctomycetales bacterium]|nr:sulfatase-like hydrolase/transferase [Planctomycetales bacterium]